MTTSQARLHLLWAVPTALVLAVLPWVVASFSLCGLYGCGGGGMGVADDLRFLVLPALLVAAGVVALPFAVLRWTEWTTGRVLVAVVVGTIALVAAGTPLLMEYLGAAPPADGY